MLPKLVLGLQTEGKGGFSRKDFKAGLRYTRQDSGEREKRVSVKTAYKNWNTLVASTTRRTSNSTIKEQYSGEDHPRPLT